MAATYLTWLAPPEPWTFAGAVEAAERRALEWRSPDGQSLFDVLVTDGDRRSVVAALWSARTPSAVRLIQLDSPMRSVVSIAPTRRIPLRGSEWDFSTGAGA